MKVLLNLEHTGNQILFKVKLDKIKVQDMIEDISYLKNNSDNDSISFYVDSGKRDKRYWPSPSEYSLTFDQPFKLVFGFDVLDAAIPTTKYNIDNENCVLAFTLFSVQTGNDLGNIESFIIDLSYNKEFVEMFDEINDNTSFLLSNDTIQTFNIHVLSPSIQNTTYYAFEKIIVNNVPIQPRTNQLPSEYYFFRFEQKDYAIANTSENLKYIDLIAYESYNLTYASSNESTIVYFKRYKIDSGLSRLIESNGLYEVKVENVRFNLEIGNYDISTLRNELNVLLNIYDIEVETTTPIESKQGRYRFTSSSKIIIMNGTRTTLKENLGFSMLPDSSQSSMYKIFKIGENPYVFMSLWDEFTRVYKLEAPGLINLFGERYVILRIKEIEDHLLGSYSYMSMSPGIGMFKLAASYNDVTNLRFDYVSLVRKPFHPIGKVSKLTFRFETAKGDLYDFKGVNHQLLMVIKFLVPSQKNMFNKSILNPSYDPNFMNYMASMKGIQNREESDEEDFDDEDNYRKYKKELDKYEYVSSSTEDSSDNDSEIDVSEMMRQRRLIAS